MLKSIITGKLKYLLGLLLVFLAPIIPAMIAVCILIGIDFIMGLFAAVKTKVKITSSKMSQTLIKLLVYQLLIFASYLTMIYLMPWFPLVKIVLAFIGMTEFLSIGEKFTLITGLPFVKFLRGMITKYMKRYSNSE